MTKRRLNSLVKNKYDAVLNKIKRSGGVGDENKYFLNTIKPKKENSHLESNISREKFKVKTLR